MDEYISQIRARVLQRMDLSRDMLDEEIEEFIAEETAQMLQGKIFSLRERVRIEQQVFNSLRKLDALQDLVDDPEVSEIMVNGPQNIFYEKFGCVHKWEQSFASEEKMQDIIQQIVGRHNRVVNLSNPIVDTRLSDGSRVNIEHPLDMETLIEKGAISKEAADFLKYLVQAKYSLLISGGTSSGNANMEGVMPVTIRDLIRSALRMRPDRIIVGECRGAEAFDMLQALNTGHDGGLSTAHGNSSRDILSRLEMMVLMGMDLPLQAIRQQIASGIDVIVHLGRLPDRSRKVLEITEVTGFRDGEILLSPLYQLQQDGDKSALVAMKKLKCTNKLIMSGLEDIAIREGIMHGLQTV